MPMTFDSFMGNKTAKKYNRECDHRMIVRIYTVGSVNSEIFARILFLNCVKRHICHVKKSRFGPDFPTSVNGRVSSPFYKGFILK